MINLTDICYAHLYAQFNACEHKIAKKMTSLLQREKSKQKPTTDPITRAPVPSVAK